MRLQVFLSHNGICSRRKAMDHVKFGDVKVNGKSVLEPSFEVDPNKDRITFKNNPVEVKAYQYLKLNKPQGYVTTKEDKHADKTIYDLVGQEFLHLVPAGRLDKDTEGLLVLTNDGDVAYSLTHPKFNIDKEYFVRVLGKLTKSDIKKIEEGIVLDGSKTAPAKFKKINWMPRETEFLFVIHEGKKRQIRRMFLEFGYEVIHLKRLVQGPITLGDLKRGKSVLLTAKEINQLKGLSQKK